jgi:hypothetical protein
MTAATAARTKRNCRITNANTAISIIDNAPYSTKRSAPAARDKLATMAVVVKARTITWSCRYELSRRIRTRARRFAPTIAPVTPKANATLAPLNRA